MERVGVETLVGVDVGNVGCSTLGVIAVVTREGGRVTCGIVGAGSFKIAMNVSTPFLRVSGIDRMLFQRDSHAVAIALLSVVIALLVLSMIVFMNTPQPSDIPLEAPRS